MPFVPDDFAVPRELVTPAFRLEPLGPQYNEADHAAWTSSIGHIRATPGFENRTWPPADGMPITENLSDLERHAKDFAERRGFTFTVLDDTVIGCVYIYPAKDDPQVTRVHSWVTASRAQLDKPLYTAVSAWLAADWPFEKIEYAPR
ncbi:hypothetical protein Aple_021750 [Acrocarpospora pleiomorpha]|uniref:Twin-arginine translocation pathway signal protein n=1 Tax=Acrocarpospora pleiomorpha TaxID=90975 RepID=A0A5M3XGL5_9ACTN|nr:N-acetyltransferase [Acrocarpospora pleiomorpha]GES19279.1 hypothetical protein Aple_021750 [Acrocarpospora pleiomorpha]